MATIKDKFNMICKLLNIEEYYKKGFTGQNVIIASIEESTSDHGKKVKNTVLSYAPDVKFISFSDTHDYSSVGDDGKTVRFPEFADWCIENNVDIITSSLDWDVNDPREKEAVKKLYDNGIIFCNCAGNSGNNITRNGDHTYSLYDEIVTVSGVSLDINGKLTWSGFNYGEPVDVVTIGQNVPIIDNGFWSNWSGTSAATPLFASLLALVKSTGFKLTSKGVFALIDMYNKPFIYKDITYKMFVLPPLEDLLNRVNQDISKGDDSNMDNNAPSEWSKEAISYMKEIGITDGTRPKDNITREEVITLLYRLIQKIKKDYE